MPDFQTSDGVQMHYETWGDPASPPVVLLHGFTASLRMWNAQVEPLSADYFVVAPDLRGHGASDAPEDLDTYTLERFALDIRELLDEMSIEICALAGCSFGGMIALQFGVLFPERLACLVISDASPAYEHPAYDERFHTREAGMLEHEKLAEKLGMAGLGKKLAAGMSDPFLADGIRSRYARLSLAGFLGSSRTRRERPDLTPLLRDRLAMPVMLCDGDEDPVYCALAVMANELPEARVVTFAGAGHGLPVQRPEPFTDELFAFLEDVEAGRPVAGQRKV